MTGGSLDSLVLAASRISKTSDPVSVFNMMELALSPSSLSSRKRATSSSVKVNSSESTSSGPLISVRPHPAKRMPKLAMRRKAMIGPEWNVCDRRGVYRRGVMGTERIEGNKKALITCDQEREGGEESR